MVQNSAGMILNRQRDYALKLGALRSYVKGMKRSLRMGRGSFNVCFVNDREIRRLNARYRGNPRPTDVLSFPWQEASGTSHHKISPKDFRNFLGDVVISVDTARRNAHLEGHSTLHELRWLILHGVLHLLGYDHERDGGKMTRLELSLREQLGIAGSRVSRTFNRPSKPSYE